MSNKTTYNLTETVYLHVRFSTDEQLSNFLHWQMDNSIYSNVRGGWTGGIDNSHGGFYSQKNVERIREYLQSIKAHFTPLL